MRQSTRFVIYSKIAMGIFLLFPIILLAQVKIKERVEISPHKNLLNSIQTETHPLELNFVFTATTENVIRLGVWSECGGSPQSVSGNHSVSLTYPYTGGIAYSPQLHVEDFYKDIPVLITVTLGSRTITDTSYSMYAYPCGGYDQTWTCPSFGMSHLYADLKCTLLNPAICTGESENIVLEPEYKSCSIGDYDPPTENVTLTVIHGSELGGMTLDGVNIQPSVTLPVKSRRFAWFVARDTLPNGIFIDTAEIQIQAGILTTTKKIPVRNCQEELCPVVFTSKESMAPGDTSIITILGKNSSNVIGPYPPEQTFNVQLAQGAEYGNLQLLSGGPLSKGLTNTPYQCLYIANNEVNNDSIHVQVQAWANGQLGKRTDAQNPMAITACGNATEDIVIEGFHHFNISIVPDTVSVADTIAYTEGAKLLIQAQNKDNIDIEYDPNTLLKFSLTTNEDYGTFIKVNGDTLETTPTTPVQLTDVPYNKAKEGKIKFVANKKNPDSLVTCKIRVEKQDDATKYGEKEAVVIKKDFPVILLGETKYYFINKDLKGRAFIDTTTNPSFTPSIHNPWPDNPISVVQGSKSGVYWEKKKSDGTALDSGMIRLIGRYWRADTIYKVQLKTVYGSDTLKKIIEVNKPGKLGNSYNTIKDCFGKTITLDSIIIKFAGENGIPPQMIKGQMEKESSFKPKWRYEPFQDAQRKIDNEIFQTNKFVITENSMGLSFPPSHSNSSVYPTFYIQSQIMISQYLYNYWENRYVRYGETDNDPDFILGSKNLNDQWNSEWKKIKDNVKNPKDSAHNFVKSLIMDTSTVFGKGFDRLAQTRIFTSYGFTQMMYTLAITEGKFNVETKGRYKPTGTQYMYKDSSNQYPEMLNEQNILMPRYCDFLLGKLHLLFNSSIPESQWKITNRKIKIDGIIRTFNCNGFEECWKNALQLYNFYEPGYGNDVWNRSQKYLPK